jgi:hypothetical protein
LVDPTGVRIHGLSQGQPKVSLLVWSVTDHGFEPQSGQPKVSLLVWSVTDHGFEPQSGQPKVSLLVWSVTDLCLF